MARSYDPAKMAARWASGMAGATQKYTDGVNSYDGNPGDAAVQHKDAMISGFNAAMAPGGKWETNVVAGGRTWKTNAAKIGAANLATGSQKGQPKQQRYWAAAGPQYADMVATVRAMPNANDAQKRARAVAWWDLAQQRLTGLGKS